MHISAKATAVFLCVATLFHSHRVLALGSLPWVPTQQSAISYSTYNDALKVPGNSPAHYCSDPSTDIFKIQGLYFYPKNPRIGYYFMLRFLGTFTSSTGDIPWLNVTGSFNGRSELSPLFDAPLCDINVFQQIQLPGQNDVGTHRSCPPAIQEGYAEIQSPHIPVQPPMVPDGLYEIRANATTQDGRSIFYVEGSFNITW
ncbi:hypothetical protein LOCC1_G008622 [Lachnellula occidentalis]|uniref:ML-like domain-containing protein n=1 Tax=Lachnellula occidentalis TaxID=215460 RepID=A0A8H8RG47_9HELO|nr:hypothetical protein LOCC1_G008622 [Lachnellula occidentalis]